MQQGEPLEEVVNILPEDLAFWRIEVLANIERTIRFCHIIEDNMFWKD